MTTPVLTHESIVEQLKSTAATIKKKISFSLFDKSESETDTLTLHKSIQNLLNGGPGVTIERLAFEEDPTRQNDYAALYKPKLRGIPDQLLKRIAIQDSLVAAVVLTRSNHVSAFGRAQEDRFTTGFKIEPRRGVMEKASDKQQEELQDRIDDVTRRLLSCGKVEGWDTDRRLSFAQYLSQITRDAIVVGRFSTEIIWVNELGSPDKKFHSFRPADAGTMYKAKPRAEAAAAVRREALHLLESVKNRKLIPERFQNDEYSWVQVIEGKPEQAFTSKEMLVHSMYPVTDYEQGGYPITPLDTVIAEVTTHINITNHNKLYFQSGRATRGMLVIKSADVDASVVQSVRQQFNASINSVQNAWRMPVFGINPEDEIVWQPIDAGSGRDMEFQYLSDSNVRAILSAFQMSPEELPGYQHLSRGTNNQALSESNNEWKMTAARDVGFRPLLSQIQDFINESLLPLLDPTVAKLCYFKFVGLDADTPEKEVTRLQQEAPVHFTYAEVLEKVEKDPVPAEFGGRYPLNPAFQQIVEKYKTFGEIQEFFFNEKGASKDPTKQFYQNPMWFQYQQMQIQMQQLQQQQQMMEQQQAQEQAQQESGGGSDERSARSRGGGGVASGGEGDEGDDSSRKCRVHGCDESMKAQGYCASHYAKARANNWPIPAPDDYIPDDVGTGEIGSGADQLMAMLQKSENHLPYSRKKLLAQHNLTVKHIMDQWERDALEVQETILKEIKDMV